MAKKSKSQLEMQEREARQRELKDKASRMYRGTIDLKSNRNFRFRVEKISVPLYNPYVTLEGTLIVPKPKGAKIWDIK
ncbi:MAG: hypothetical protein ACC618_03450 [Patescibacteria group bacterium]